MDHKLSPANVMVLDDPLTAEKVEASLSHMHLTKAPEVDGMPALFYKKFWHVVGLDVTNVYLSIMNGQVSLESINRTLLVLIPKIKKPQHASQFRPISLCNVLFKLVIKTIANRLKVVLSDLINESQSAFVQERLITDNALIAFECFYHMKRKTKGRKGTVTLKLDMAKAYDRI